MKRNARHDHAEDVIDAQPTSVTELAPIVNEFVERLRVLEHEEETLRENKKDLVTEFKDKLDTKTLALALKLVSLKKKVQHKDTFDLFTEILGEV